VSWIKRLSASLRPHKLEHDLERELDFHLDMRVREKTAVGASPREARQEALGRFGNRNRVIEDCRDQAAFAWIGALRQDLRYAARNIARHPGFTAAAAACIAVGIGANTAIFSFVNAFLFQPIPKDVVMVQRGSGSTVSFPEFQDWRHSNRVFNAVAAYSPGDALTIGRGAGSTRALGETVAGDYFEALGIAPAAGRLLRAGDETEALAVVSHRLWRSDPTIVGATLWINRQPFTVIGVAPPGFQGMLAPWSTSVWVTPFARREVLADRRAGAFLVFARLQAGITAMLAAAAMNTLDRELARLHPDPQRDPHDGLTVARRGGLSGSPVWGVFLVMSALLMTVAGIIFLIACANVSGLLVARSLARRREMMIRLSLGAGRGRLARQLLTESTLLALLGGIAGMALAYSAGDSLAGLMPQSITGGFAFRHAIDIHVLAFAVALSAASVMVSAVLPAWRASDQCLSPMRKPRLRQFLLIAQVAGSVLVLATAALFIRTFQKTRAVDVGLDPAHVLTADLDLRQMRFSRTQAVDFRREVRSRVAALPGVTAVSLANVVPLGDTQVLNIPQMGQIATATVDHDYFRTVGLPLLRGRAPGAQDRNVAVVNEAFARRFWPDQESVGKSLVPASGKPALQVIGVTVTRHYWSLDEARRPFVYQIANDPGETRSVLIIRTEAPPRGILTAVATAIQSADPELPAMPVRTEDERISRWLEPQRSGAVLLGVLGFSALGLAIAGLFALLSQIVAQRSVEIALRVALGATRASIAAWLLRQCLVLMGVGAFVGLAIGAAVARLLAHNLGPIGSLDAVGLAGIFLVLATAGAAAALVPTWRATRVDPAVMLRSE